MSVGCGLLARNPVGGCVPHSHAELRGDTGWHVHAPKLPGAPGLLAVEIAPASCDKVVPAREGGERGRHRRTVVAVVALDPGQPSARESPDEILEVEETRGMCDRGHAAEAPDEGDRLLRGKRCDRHERR